MRCDYLRALRSECGRLVPFWIRMQALTGFFYASSPTPRTIEPDRSVNKTGPIQRLTTA